MNSLVLKVHQFVIDLLNINLCPQYITVAVDAVHDSVVEGVQLDQQVELLLNPSQLLVLGHRETKELFSIRVNLEALPEVVEAGLEHAEPLAGLPRCYTVYHGAILRGREGREEGGGRKGREEGGRGETQRSYVYIAFLRHRHYYNCEHIK